MDTGTLLTLNDFISPEIVKWILPAIGIFIFTMTMNMKGVNKALTKDKKAKKIVKKAHKRKLKARRKYATATAEPTTATAEPTTVKIAKKKQKKAVLKLHKKLNEIDRDFRAEIRKLDKNTGKTEYADKYIESLPMQYLPVEYLDGYSVEYYDHYALMTALYLQ